MIVQITMQTNQAQMYEILALYIQTHCLDRFYPFQYITKNFQVICLFYFFQGNNCCTVNSFTKYTAKLNPSDPNLRQKPVNEVSETKPVWYDNNEQIATTMLNISKDAELPVIYTNYCILTRKAFLRLW